uniref:C-type lectin domain-containing protein n=1 Tax=Astyanax mexicanus TaxID=7994 RepID=A0A8B9KLR6_ASTMX
MQSGKHGKDLVAVTIKLTSSYSQLFPSGPAGSLRQYCFVNEPKRWAEAQSYCRSNHTDLATVDNMNDLRKLLESAKGTYSGSAWIGLYDDPGHSWRWSLDDPQFYKEGEREFRRWNGHPLNECGIVCALMLLNTHPLYEGKWIEKSCAEEHQFICYKGKRNPRKVCF